MTEINSDPQVAQWLGPIEPSRTRERIAAWSEHWQRHGFGLWAVDEKARETFIGRVGLVHHEDWRASDHDAEIGWTLAADTWGRGYATEAARAALEFARELGLRRIVSITLPDNTRSRRVMEKLGLVYQGDAHWRGLDHVWYAIDLQPTRSRCPKGLGTFHNRRRAGLTGGWLRAGRLQVSGA